MSDIKNHSIKVIFSDLFGVLLGPDYSDVLHYVQKTTKQPINKIYSRVFDDTSMQLLRGEIDFAFFFNQLQYKIKNSQDLDLKKFKSYWIKMKMGEMPLVKHLLDIKKSYKICIITNTTQSHLSSLQFKYDFINKFDKCITSDVARAYKPNPTIFHYACNLLDVNPDESIFIDDSKANTIAACKLGMLGHHYNTYTNFLKFITTHSIN